MEPRNTMDREKSSRMHKELKEDLYQSFRLKNQIINTIEANAKTKEQNTLNWVLSVWTVDVPTYVHCSQ